MKLFLDLSRFHKQLLAVSLDFLLLPCAFYLAVWLRYDNVNIDLLRHYLWLILAVPIISIPIFIRIGLYRAVIRFIDQKIVYIVIFGVTLSVLVMALLAFLITNMQYLSRSVFGIYWVSAIMYMVASRFIARGYFLHAVGSAQKIRVAIYGSVKEGGQLINALRSGNYLPVAFIDDKTESHGSSIAGIKVYKPEALPELIHQKKIKEILLAMPSLTKSQRKRILDRLEQLKVKTKVALPVESLVNGENSGQQMREIEIEDVLGRDPVEPYPRLLAACIVGRNVMVTGAGGSIGSELCRQILRLKPQRLILLELSEFALYAIEQDLQLLSTQLKMDLQIMPFLGSVLETEKCTRIMQTFAVNTLYHAAAYKHVPLVEHNSIEGVRNNIFGTLGIAQAALAAKIDTFVLISTDKAVRPTNVMGATKRFAELILQAFSKQPGSTRFCIVRFGNVLGSSGSVVPLFRRQIMAGGPITITHPEITRYFMTIPEAAQLVLQAGAMGAGGEVFVLDMGEPVKIMDLAKRMVHLSGFDIKNESNPDGEIEIQYVGLRPGEKLYEELLIGDNVEGTEHPLILRAQENEIPWRLLQDYLAGLQQACDSFDYPEIRFWLLKVVPEYTPQGEIEDFMWREQPKQEMKPLLAH